MSADPTEQSLLRRLETEPGRRERTLQELAVWYRRAGRHQEAIARLEEFCAISRDTEGVAVSLLAMGGRAEEVADFVAAVAYYEAALKQNPNAPEVRYFVRNNLGFSLNQLGRFVEGEACCRTAIPILPERPNAHKNLGLALAGQGRWREAAACYVEATRVRPSDPRSCAHLEQLLRDHPGLVAEFGEAARDGRNAVGTARAWAN